MSQRQRNLDSGVRGSIRTGETPVPLHSRMPLEGGQLSGRNGGEIVLIKIPEPSGGAIGGDLEGLFHLDPGSRAVGGEMVAAVGIGGVGAMVVGRPGGAIFKHNILGCEDPARVGCAQFNRTARGKGSLEVDPVGDAAQVLVTDLPLVRRGSGIQAGEAAVEFGTDPNGERVCLGRVQTDGFGFSGGIIVQGVKVEIVPRRARGKEFLGIITGVDGEADADLLLVIEALSAFGFFFGTRQDGQQHGGEDSDDGDDDEKFDEGESPHPLTSVGRVIRLPGCHA